MPTYLIDDQAAFDAALARLRKERDAEERSFFSSDPPPVHVISTQTFERQYQETNERCRQELFSVFKIPKGLMEK